MTQRPAHRRPAATSGVAGTDSQALARSFMLTSIVVDQMLPKLGNARVDHPGAPTKTGRSRGIGVGEERFAAPPCATRATAIALVGFEVEALAQALARADRTQAATVIATALRQRSVREVLLDLFAPTARRLGDLWNEDSCSFVDVAAGLAWLENQVRLLAPEGIAAPEDAPRLLLAACEGEAHGFGLAVLRRIFEEGGWVVDVLTQARPAAMIAHVSRQWVDLIGVSVGSSAFHEPATRLIAAARQASLNRQAFVMVGGPGLVGIEAPARLFLADFSADTADEAFVLASGLTAYRKLAPVGW